jgi:hypothetical protein
VYDNYRRPNERIYDAQVTSVRAVYAADGGSAAGSIATA